MVCQRHTQASSSIWQSNGLQNRRLRVQVLPGLPGHEDTVSWEREWDGVLECRKLGRRRDGFVAKSAVQKKTEKKKGENAIVRYFRETWFELRKVSWPTRSEAINLTLIVVAVTGFLAIVLGVLDWVFQTAFGLFL
jgi:preprotein translocase subunit SecE